MTADKRKGLVSQVVKSSKTKVHKPKIHKPVFPIGSTLLNLACSDNPNAAVAPGKMVNVIGDSSSGKTMLVMTALAEITRMSEFDDYEIIYDDAEQALTFDMEYLFGETAASRISPPGGYDSDGDTVDSHTMQDFYSYVFNRTEAGKPFIYVLDSLDSLTSTEELEKVTKTLDAYEKGNKVPGSFGMDKPKSLSQMFRVITSGLKKSNSLLIVISQTRDNIDPMSFAKKTRSGGKALKFYASHEIWLGNLGKDKQKDRVIGVNVRGKVTKNKLTGKERQVDFSIFYDLGVDDTRDNINFLVKEEAWIKTGQTIVPKGLSDKVVSGRLTKVIDSIEEHSEEDNLKQLVGEKWKEIEDSLKLGRKRRF